MQKMSYKSVKHVLKLDLLRLLLLVQLPPQCYTEKPKGSIYLLVYLLALRGIKHNEYRIHIAYKWYLFLINSRKSTTWIIMLSVISTGTLKWFDSWVIIKKFDPISAF